MNLDDELNIFNFSKTLANILGVEKRTYLQYIRELEEKGFVKFEPDSLTIDPSGIELDPKGELK